MNTRWKHDLLVLYSAILVFQSVSVMAGEIKLATQEKGHQLSAATMPIVKCTLDRINRPHVILQIPWGRAQKGAEDGTYDGFFIATRNQKRDSFAVLSEPLVTIKWVYVVNRDAGISPDDVDFMARRFGADTGSARFRWLQKKHNIGTLSQEVSSVSAPSQLLKMLLTKRIDVALLNTHGFETAIDSLTLEADNFNTFIMREIPAGLYITKKLLRQQPKFLTKFNKALSTCKKEPGE